MVDILIFSKDRALQLELLLRSIKQKLLLRSNVSVLYKTSNEIFNVAYDELKKEYPEVCFIRESGFQSDVIKIVSTFKNRFCIFFCDDDVFINEVTEKELNELILQYDSKPIHSISLRMNPNINYCYPARKEIAPPTFIEKEKFLLWDWRTCNIHYCWGYPMAVNSHIYETNKIFKVISGIGFRNPNDLECHLNRNRFQDKPLLISFKESKVFCVQNNFVKPDKGQSFEIDVNSAEFLNSLFLKGKRIDTKNIYGLKENKAHGTIEYLTN